MKLSELMSKIQEILDFDGDMEVVAEGTDPDTCYKDEPLWGKPVIVVAELHGEIKKAFINHEPNNGRQL